MNSPSSALKSLQAAFAAQTNPDAHQRRAFADFLARGLPTAKLDAWKYTDLRRLALKEFRSATNANAHGIVAGLLPLNEGARLVFVDGRLSESMSRNAEGVTIETQSSVTVLGTEAFDLLNAAFSTGTIEIHVQAEQSDERPIYIAFAWTKSAGELMAHPRVRIKVRNRAKAVVVEQHIGENSVANFRNTILDIEVGEEAALQHVRIQDDADVNFNIGAARIDVARGARYINHHYSSGGGLSRADVTVRLLGEGAETELHGLIFAQSTQHLDVRTCIEHDAPNTRSREDYRGVANHRGRVVFNGKVIVAKNAQRTDAAQSSRNLLLSPHAEIDTRPELEIYANDVKCAHGATVGQLDASALFYLRSRGIDQSEARALLTQAFTTEVVERIPLHAVREHVLNRLAARMRSVSTP